MGVRGRVVSSRGRRYDTRRPLGEEVGVGSPNPPPPPTSVELPLDLSSFLPAKPDRGRSMPDSPVHTTKSRRIHIVPRSWGRIELLALALAPAPALLLLYPPLFRLLLLHLLILAVSSPRVLLRLLSFGLPFLLVLRPLVLPLLLLFSRVLDHDVIILVVSHDREPQVYRRGFQFPVPTFARLRFLFLSFLFTRLPTRSQEKSTWLSFLLVFPEPSGSPWLYVSLLRRFHRWLFDLSDFSSTQRERRGREREVSRESSSLSSFLTSNVYG